MQSSPFTATISSPATTMGCDLSLFRSVSPSFSTQKLAVPHTKKCCFPPPKRNHCVGVYRTVRPTSRFHHVSSQWMKLQKKGRRSKAFQVSNGRRIKIHRQACQYKPIFFGLANTKKSVLFLVHIRNPYVLWVI